MGRWYGLKREERVCTFIIELSVFTYDSASYLVLCVKCYIGPCGVLVPMGTVHSNNEFEFEFEYSIRTCENFLSSS